jgi:hypothetical protein
MKRYPTTINNISFIVTFFILIIPSPEKIYILIKQVDENLTFWLCPLRIKVKGGTHTKILDEYKVKILISQEFFHK